MQQIYANYTQEDQQVWNILFNRQMPNLKLKATNDFNEGIDKVNFNATAIPDFNQINVLLKDLTGWKIQAVPGIVPDDVFFKMMAEKIFPATAWIRKMSQMDYLEEPDMFHDVFAHVPLLSNPHFAGFLQAISKLSLKYIDNPYMIELISRIYWFTVEFGLILEEGELKIYGAGILSSAGETAFCLGGDPEIRNFDVWEILHEPYVKDKFQVKYFVINSYEQLFNSIFEVERMLEKESIMQTIPVDNL